MKVELVHNRSGDVKEVKVGFSWTLLLFSGLMGLPLFFRGLSLWGGFMLAIWAANLFGTATLPANLAGLLTLVLFCVSLFCSFYLGFKGNELTAKQYLERGYQFAKPKDTDTEFAKKCWNIVSLTET